MMRRYPYAVKLIAAGLMACTTIPVATRCKWRCVTGISGEIVQFAEDLERPSKRAATNLQSLPERMNPSLSETNQP